MPSNKILKIVFIVLAIGFTTQVYAQTRVKMDKMDGNYFVPCQINGLELNLIFDPGASHVTLSLTEAQFMLKNGLIFQSDLSGTPITPSLEKESSGNTELSIRELRIGNITLRDVKANVVHDMTAPLLFGQSAITKLGEYHIESDDLVISGPVEQSSSDPCEIAQIDLNNAVEARSAGERSKDESKHTQACQFYTAALINCPDQYPTEELLETARYMTKHKSYKSAITFYQHYLNVFHWDSPNDENINIEIGKNQQLLGDYDEAYSSYLRAYLNSGSKTTNQVKVRFQSLFGNLEFERGNYQEAKQRFEYAAQYRLTEILASPDDINNNKVTDEALGKTLLMISSCCSELGIIKEGQTYLVLSAKCGNGEANSRCTNIDLNPRKDAPWPLENLLIYPSVLE